LSEDKVSVNIPRSLYEKIEKKIAGTIFTSVEEYVALLLENEFPEEAQYSEEEEALIRERLKKLGYIE